MIRLRYRAGLAFAAAAVCGGVAALESRDLSSNLQNWNWPDGFQVDPEFEKKIQDVVAEASTEIGALQVDLPGVEAEAASPHTGAREVGFAVNKDWLRLPPTAFDLAMYIQNAGAFRAGSFLRHAQLNPRDVVIGEDCQNKLERVLSGVSRRLGALRDAHASIATREAMSLAAINGENLPFVLGKRDTVVNESGQRVEMEFFAAGTGDVLLRRLAGGAYRIPESALPGATLAREHRRFLLVELAVALVAFFESRGALSPEEALRLREEILGDLMA